MGWGGGGRSRGLGPLTTLRMEEGQISEEENKMLMRTSKYYVLYLSPKCFNFNFYSLIGQFPDGL